MLNVSKAANLLAQSKTGAYMRTYMACLPLAFGLSTIAGAADLSMSIKEFHVGMALDECHSVVNKYSWSGVDHRKNKRVGLPAFTLAGAAIPDSPTCSTYSGAPDNTATSIDFNIPGSAMVPIARARRYQPLRTTAACRPMTTALSDRASALGFRLTA